MRRTWIKLYVDQCLRGSMIEELTPAQRWLWVGLLLMAGDSSAPGSIFRRKDADGIPIGYSDITLAETLDVDLEVYQSGIARMVEKNKVSVDSKGVISIINWTKYQSEYQRQRPYRDGYKADCNPSDNVDIEGDVEGDIEEEASVDIRLTQLLIDLMLRNNPESAIIKKLTDKRKAEWVRACRLLRESDSRTPEQIEGVVRFSQDDKFWKSNILSMPKLREKWDQLWMKAKNPVGRGEVKVSQIGKSEKKVDSGHWAERRAKENELRVSGLDEEAIKLKMVEWAQESYDRSKAKEGA